MIHFNFLTQAGQNRFWTPEFAQYINAKMQNEIKIWFEICGCSPLFPFLERIGNFLQWNTEASAAVIIVGEGLFIVLSSWNFAILEHKNEI